MVKVLNQDEIDALFQRARNQKAGSTPNQQLVTACEFTSGQITKEQLRLVTGLHETFARNLTHGLGAYLRVGLEIAVVSVEQIPYGEFLRRVPEPSYFSSFKINELEGEGLINMELPVAYPILDLLLGGRGRPETNVRGLTEIEQNILAGIMIMVVHELTACWSSIGLSFAFDQNGNEVSDMISADERVMTVSFEVRLPEVQAMLNIVFPLAVSSLIQRNQNKGPGRRQSNSPSRELLRRRMMLCEFPVELGLPRVKVPARELIEMKVGSVLMLPHKAQEPVSLKVAGTSLFSAYPVARNESRAGYIHKVTCGQHQNGGGDHAE